MYYNGQLVNILLPNSAAVQFLERNKFFLVAMLKYQNKTIIVVVVIPQKLKYFEKSITWKLFEL